jgi:hypothetical protein
MADEERGRDLPQRVRGATRAAPPAPVPSSSPALSDELRRRTQAAVAAERSEAAIQEQEHTTGSQRRTTTPAADSDVTVQLPEGINGKRKQAAGPESDVRTGRTSKPERSAKPERTAKPRPDDKAERAAKPEAVARARSGVFAEEDDELTEWVSPHPVTQGKLAGARPASSKQAAPAQAGRPVSPPPGVAKKPSSRRAGGRRGTWLVLVVLAGLAVGVLAVAAVRVFARPPARPTTAQLHEETAARAATAAWVAQHVSRDATVACDQVMCAALTARGFPARELLVLGPTSGDPFRSAGVVVETPAVLSLFGSSLAAAWAPDVLASFGSGPARITIRVVAQHGAAAYRAALNLDLAARKTAGAALLNDSQIFVPALAGEQLTAGQVDSRVLLALADLAGHQPVRIVQFGNDGPGASAGIPLRFVDLAESVSAAHQAPAAYVKSVRAYLGRAGNKYRPASMTTVVLANGQAVLRVDFSAPSPLGVFGTPGSS